MKTIKIKDNANYSGRTMKWTETMHTGTLPSGTKLYHVSDSPIKAFLPIETCFFAECPNIDGNYYELTLECDADCMISLHGEEIRVDLDTYRNHVSISYVGSVSSEYTGERAWVPAGLLRGCPIKCENGVWLAQVMVKKVTDSRWGKQ